MMSKEQIAEEIKLQNEFVDMFVKAVKPYLPTIQIYNCDAPKGIDYFQHVMITIEHIDKSEIRDGEKNTWWPVIACIFIGTDINPNGIDSTGRIGRTWNISFEIKGSCRRYRHKRIERDVQVVKYYEYTEDPIEGIERFISWIKQKAGNTFISHIVPITIQ